MEMDNTELLVRILTKLADVVDRVADLDRRISVMESRQRRRTVNVAPNTALQALEICEGDRDAAAMLLSVTRAEFDALIGG